MMTLGGLASSGRVRGEVTFKHRYEQSEGQPGENLGKGHFRQQEQKP